MTNRLERFAQVAEIFTAFGVLFAVLAYWSDLQAQRKQFTFEYAQNFYRDPVREARMILRDAVGDAESLDGRTLTNEEVALVLRVEVEAGVSALTETHAITLSDYFVGAERCVLADLCAKHIFEELHAEEARYILCFLGPIYQSFSLDGGYSATTSGLDTFAGKKSEC